jgi:hypothetical protein
MMTKQPARIAERATGSEAPPDPAATFGMVPPVVAVAAEMVPPERRPTEDERRAALDRIAAIGAPYALRKDKLTGKVIEPDPVPRTVRWWGLTRKWPAWLVDSMAAQRFPNQELTEIEAEDLALATAGLPLGKAKV